MLLNRFWKDENGFVVSTEMVLVATILVIGMIVGLSTVRDQLLQELGDVASGSAKANQSYSFLGLTGHTSSAGGSGYLDKRDFCDFTPNPFDCECQTTCITVNNPASQERTN